MYRNFVFTGINQALPAMLEELEKRGEEVGSRAGRTKELMHTGITLLEPLQREILIPERKASIAAQIAETAWVLAGRDDVEFLERYLPRAKDFSDDGIKWRASYGKRLRAWCPGTDQLRWLVDHLKEDRSSRRAVMSIWDPVVDTAPGKDIPCNDWLNFSSRLGQMDLHVAVRSNDAIWGWSGINQFEWSVLLEVVAGLTGNEVGSLHFSTTSFHIYDRHWDKGRRIWKDNPLHRARFWEASPRFDAAKCPDTDMLDGLLDMWFEIENQIRNGLEADSLVDGFPEPMLQSWLRVLQWWWTGDRDYLQPLEGTRLAVATEVSVQPKETPEQRADRHNRAVVLGYAGGPDALRKYLPTSPFLEALCKLHLEKEAAYGGSWKRRGEMLGIMANIARKVDRLQTRAVTAEETSADTAGDLLVYLAKYRTWLEDQKAAVTGGPMGRSDDPTKANDLLRELERKLGNPALFTPAEVEWAETRINEQFDRLEKSVTVKDPQRIALVDDMLINAYMLARTLWEKERHLHEYSIPKKWVMGLPDHYSACCCKTPFPCPVHGEMPTNQTGGRETPGDEYRGADRD